MYLEKEQELNSEPIYLKLSEMNKFNLQKQIQPRNKNQRRDLPFKVKLLIKKKVCNVKVR